MRDTFSRRWFTVSLCSFILCYAGTAGGIGFIKNVRVPQVPPSTKTKVSDAKIFYACYAAYNGAAIDCSFSHYLTGMAEPIGELDNNGGHVSLTNASGVQKHVLGDRPLLLEGHAIDFVADLDPSPYGVAGFTFETPPWKGALLRHPVSMLSGNLAASGVLVLPVGWTCAANCYDSISWRINFTIDVGVGGLEKLVATPSDPFVIARGDNATHPDGVYGTGDTIDKLERISKKYKGRTGRPLSVNDISLIKGGLMDWKTTWNPPHHTHRRGTDVDINTTDGGGSTIACFQNPELRLAVIAVANGAMRPLLHCENKKGHFVPPDDPTGINYHIEF